MSTFYVDLTTVDDWSSFQQIMDEYYEEHKKYIRSLALELKVSVGCATDVLYLRSRSWHTDELEKELIRLHQEGNPPNVCEFGCTGYTFKTITKNA